MKTRKEIYARAWKFFDKYAGQLPKTSEDWHALLMEAENKFSAPYIGSEYEQFSVKLISTLILELETMTKGKNTES